VIFVAVFQDLRARPTKDPKPRASRARQAVERSETGFDALALEPYWRSLKRNQALFFVQAAEAHNSGLRPRLPVRTGAAGLPRLCASKIRCP